MTKEAILSILRNTNDYVSGESISKSLDISRAAVNKAVKTLRSEGYLIDSSPNRGYILKNSPDHLTSSELGAYIDKERLDNIIVLDSVGSTNAYLHSLAYEGARDRLVVIANEQTKGRGRRGRSFSSLKDKGIYLSYLMKPNSLPQDSTTLTAWVAVAVAGAINTLTTSYDKAMIKWVNDIVINKKKVAGILTEMSIESETGNIKDIIIGIGINVNEDPEDFPDEIKGVASSLKMEYGREFKRAALSSLIIENLDRMYDNWPGAKDEYLSLYKELCITKEKEVSVLSVVTPSSDTSYDPDIRHAYVLDINEDFSLKVRFENGSVEDLNAGEVSIRGMYGYV